MSRLLPAIVSRLRTMAQDLAVPPPQTGQMKGGRRADHAGPHHDHVIALHHGVLSLAERPYVARRLGSAGSY